MDGGESMSSEEFGMTRSGNLVYYDTATFDRYFILNNDGIEMEVVSVGFSLTTWFYKGTETVVP